MTLEKQFEEELIKKSELAQKQCSAYRGKRFLQSIEKFGGIKTAKEIIRKNKFSDEFDTLAQAGLISLTMEATVIESQYSDLFTDDEVNWCYELLCDHGYYGI